MSCFRFFMNSEGHQTHALAVVLLLTASVVRSVWFLLGVVDLKFCIRTLISVKEDPNYHSVYFFKLMLVQALLI